VVAEGAARPRVVIIGGGFAGLSAAKALAGAQVEVTLLDRANYHTFQPLLYQVATAVLAPSEIASPIRWLLRRQANVTVLLAAGAVAAVWHIVALLREPSPLATTVRELKRDEATLRGNPGE